MVKYTSYEALHYADHDRHKIYYTAQWKLLTHIIGV